MFESEIFNFSGKEHYEGIKAQCREIEAKDPTFVCSYDDSALKIFLIHENKDILHKKSLWVVNHLDETGRVAYEVRVRKT